MSVLGIEEYKKEMRTFASWFSDLKIDKKLSIKKSLKTLHPSDLEKFESWIKKLDNIAKSYNLTKEDISLAAVELQFESMPDPI